MNPQVSVRREERREEERRGEERSGEERRGEGRSIDSFHSNHSMILEETMLVAVGGVKVTKKRIRRKTISMERERKRKEKESDGRIVLIPFPAR